MVKIKLCTVIQIVALLGTISLLSFFYPIEVRAAEDTEGIKIGLKYGLNAVTQCVITSPTGFILGTLEDGGFSETLPLPAYKEVTAAAKSGHVELRDEAGVLLSADIGVNGCIMPYESAEGQLISLNGQKYRGGILLKTDSGNKLTVINYLTMEEYLYGVIPGEMHHDNPLEALKAQAVAARTFAIINKDKHESMGFNLCASTCCQVYRGFESEKPSTNKAVSETRGMMIYYQNEPAAAFYSKNSGGHTQNSEDVWSTASPHLRGIADQYSPDLPWQSTMSFETLRQKLIQEEGDPGAVISVRIGERDASGAVASLIIKGKDKEVNLTKSRVRAVLGTSLVKSRHFCIGDTYEKSNQPDTGSLALLSAQGIKNATNSDRVYLLNGDGKLNTSDLISLKITKENRAVDLESFSSNTAKFDDSKIAADGSLTLTGLGYGHGVGMAQDGAIIMARQGKSFMEILKYYYTGIEVY
ncbi:MAG TPA: SpoIID/LytB domain-containing protein [Bacillota bacterium]|nr:SpoIID/LytB domain-containing protein [Bacillota bacterium]